MNFYRSWERRRKIIRGRIRELFRHNLEIRKERWRFCFNKTLRTERFCIKTKMKLCKLIRNKYKNKNTHTHKIQSDDESGEILFAKCVFHDNSEICKCTEMDRSLLRKPVCGICLITKIWRQLRRYRESWCSTFLNQTITYSTRLETVENLVKRRKKGARNDRKRKKKRSDKVAWNERDDFV